MTNLMTANIQQSLVVKMKCDFKLKLQLQLQLPLTSDTLSGSVSMMNLMTADIQQRLLIYSFELQVAVAVAVVSHLRHLVGQRVHDELDDRAQVVAAQAGALHSEPMGQQAMKRGVGVRT
jgi:hypothetical protein